MVKFDWKDPATVPLDGSDVWLWVSVPDQKYGGFNECILHAFFVPPGFIGEGKWALRWDGDNFDGIINGWVPFTKPNRRKRPFKGVDVDKFASDAFSARLELRRKERTQNEI